MTWKCFELSFEIKSPIHIGYSAKLGIVERTRYYVPGKTFWGAVVSKLGEVFCGDYENLKKFIRENLIFSYFLLKYGNEIFIPNYSEDGLRYGTLPKEKFESKFITSYISSSIDKSSGTAEEKGLHEFELIKNDRNLLLAGYLFVKEGNGIRIRDEYIFLKIENGECKLTESKGLFDVISELQIGGERIYGFGQVKLKDYKLQKGENIALYDSNIKVNLSELVVFSENEMLTALAHVNVDKKIDSIILSKGDLEPLVTREWDGKGAGGVGQNRSFEGICITPGSRFKIRNNYKIKISKYGIWEIGQLQNKS